MKITNYKYITYIILFIIIILYLSVQYHNYCIKNKLRHTIFELFEYFKFYKRRDICSANLLQSSENLLQEE